MQLTFVITSILETLKLEILKGIPLNITVRNNIFIM